MATSLLFVFARVVVEVSGHAPIEGAQIQLRNLAVHSFDMIDEIAHAFAPLDA